MPTFVKGFHLIEILIILALISILASISFPLYDAHIAHERRLEAANALSKLAFAMEKFHFENATYEGATFTRLNISKYIANHQYELIISSATNDDYELAAKPLKQQLARDSACGTLILNASGEKKISGSSEVRECW